MIAILIVLGAVILVSTFMCGWHFGRASVWQEVLDYWLGRLNDE